MGKLINATERFKRDGLATLLPLRKKPPKYIASEQMAKYLEAVQMQHIQNQSKNSDANLNEVIKQAEKTASEVQLDFQNYLRSLWYKDPNILPPDPK